MGELSKATVAIKTNLSMQGIEKNAFLQSIKKIDKRPHYWLEDDIEEFIRQKQIKEVQDKLDKQGEWKAAESPMGDALKRVALKYVRHLKDSGCILYRNMDAIRGIKNEWAPASINVFNDLIFVKDEKSRNLFDHIKENYEKIIKEGKGTSLLTKAERETKLFLPISHKYKEFTAEIVADPDFAVKDITQFTNNPNEMTYKFFDLKKIVKGGHKHWDIWESQLLEEDRYTYRAFVYSIYVAKNKGRQVLWLVDEGKSGKSKTMNAWGDFGGKHFASPIKMQQLEDKFYGNYFFGYRLILYDDCENPKLLSNSIIKSVTGGARISVDPKGAGKFDANINIKLAVGSNHRPIINDQEAEKSRLILIMIQKPNPENYSYMRSVPNLEQVLADELPAYLNTCKEAYETLCPDDGEIRLTKEQEMRVENCQSPEVTITRNFFNSYFVIDFSGSTPKSCVDRCIEEYEDFCKSKIDYFKFLNYINSKGAITQTQMEKGVIAQRYQNIRLKDKFSWDGEYLTKKEEQEDEIHFN